MSQDRDKREGRVEAVEAARGDTQLYGLTAPDASKPDEGARQGDQQGAAEAAPSALVAFGDKKIDLDKMRDSYIGELVAGRFTITQFIDRGGMGEVYLGENKAVGQRVAVKFLNRKFTSDEGIVTRFGNEAKSYARVNHPNAVTLLDYGQHEDGALYIITEFVEGKSLSRTIKREGPFTAQQAIAVAQQCCDVLTTAHKLGIVHRDLKPDNVMLIPAARGRYTVKVLDFGIAKISGEEQGSMTETGAIFGTPEFMSPEQARGEGVEPRSDLYALGIILYYMITGKLPFSGKNKFSVLNKHLHDPVPRPSDIAPQREVPPALEGVILKCLNKLPRERYDTAEDLYEALEEVRDLLGGGGALTTSAPSLRAPRNEASSEASLDASLDLDREAVPAVQLGIYASAPGALIDKEIEELSGDSVGEHELEGALEEEEEGDEEEPWEEWGEHQAPGRGRAKMLLATIGLMAAIAAVAWWALEREGLNEALLERVGNGTLDQVSGREAARQAEEETARVERVLITSQVLGLLASAEQALKEGDLAGAQRQLETTRMWLDDDALPSQGASRRRDLTKRVQGLLDEERELKRLRSKNACEPLKRAVARLDARSPGLRKRWDVIASECVEPGQRQRSEAIQQDEPEPEKPPEKPLASPIDLPDIKDILGEEPRIKGRGERAAEEQESKRPARDAEEHREQPPERDPEQDEPDEQGEATPPPGLPPKRIEL